MAEHTPRGLSCTSRASRQWSYPIVAAVASAMSMQAEHRIATWTCAGKRACAMLLANARVPMATPDNPGSRGAGR
ncbi:hypothetical protein ACK1U3_22150 [Pseudomonas promysalinigenes]|uniref:hypothetical protein n=1 Tax=Pseudomonas promysalinigenes TaxID=485898 RepID=UPI003916F6F0